MALATLRRQAASNCTPGDLCHDIYPDRSYADLIDDGVLSEGLRRYSVVLQRSAKLHQRLK
jgi:hypothetical protein